MSDDAPVTRPDVDVLIEEGLAMVNDHDYDMTSWARQAVAALAAERARADQAERRIVDAPHDTQCASRIRMYFHKPWACDCWKSAAPTAEQGSTDAG